MLVRFPGHLEGQEVVTNGEVTAVNPNAFQLSLLSAPGLSDSAIVVDGSGRAVGYRILAMLWTPHSKAILNTSRTLLSWTI